MTASQPTPHPSIGSSALPDAAAAPTKEPLALQLQGISVHIDGKQLVGGVDLQLERGSTLALLGPSGCGKTTLLRVIAGLLPPSSGDVHIEGARVTALPAQQRSVGVVFQHYALFPNMTAFDNICFGPLAQGWSKARAEARAKELLELLALQDHAQQRPHQLSGGQRQRVAIARALAAQPRLLLLDEPFSAIDESFRVSLRRTFRSLQRQLGQTCVLITHDREEAFEVSDQIATMLDGRVVQVAAPDELRLRPRTRGVADFLAMFNLYRTGPSEADAVASASPCWAAPKASLAVVRDGSATQADDALYFSATVEARYPGIHSTVVKLRADSGDALELYDADIALQPGQRVHCRQPKAPLWKLEA